MIDRTHYRSEVASVSQDASVLDAAREMYQHAVGSLVVVDESDRPIGMITDRDLTTRVVAPSLDPAATAVGGVMSKPLVTATADIPLDQVIKRMREARVRRIPIVKGEKLVGFVSLDDVLVKIGRELDDLGEATLRETIDSRRGGRKEQRRDALEDSMANLRSQVEKAAGEARVSVQRELESLRDRVRKLLE